MKRAFVVALLGVLFTIAVSASVIGYLDRLAESSLPEGPVGRYFAGCDLVDDNAFGGFAPCDNVPKKYAATFPAPDGRVSLLVFPAEVVDTPAYQAIRLRLVNRSDRTIAIAACNSQLYIVQEYLGPFGVWRPLERVPDSWCGNSFHHVFLRPNEYWEFLAPRFKESKLRFRLDHQDLDALGQKEGTTLYSSEYED